MSRLFLIILMTITLTVSIVIGANAASINCAQSTVQQAINNAQDGDKIYITGTCTWTSPVTINNKRLKLLGDEVSPPVITDGLTTHGYQQAVLSIINQNKSIQISNMTLNMGSYTATNGLIYIQGKTTTFRIDNITFNDSVNGAGRFVYIGNALGLIDHCTFNVAQNKAIQGITVVGPGQSVWTTALSLGTRYAVYVEDNTFNYSYLDDGALDAYEGARYVFRKNAVTGTNLGHHGLDSGGHASTFSFEVYNNTFTTSNNVFVGYNIRGGTGVIYNNSWGANYGASIYASYYRSSCDCNTTGCISATTNCSAGLVTPDLTGYVTDVTTAHGWGRCNGTNPLDNNSDSTGWPCNQQPGTTDVNGKIASMPIYQWLNTKGGINATMIANPAFTTINPSITDHIKANRDFYNYTTTFNGTAGVGSGSVSTRPLTCTVGVAYWATDQNILYKCAAGNTWIQYYKPFNYPHQLADPSVPKIIE